MVVVEVLEQTAAWGRMAVRRASWGEERVATEVVMVMEKSAVVPVDLQHSALAVRDGGLQETGNTYEIQV